MGAWATDSFSNDDALDWLVDFAAAPTIEMLRDTLEHVTASEADDYLEAPDCSEAIAAAEIVAALNGNPAANLPEDLKTWLQSDHGLDAAQLRPIASAAIEQIAENSELRELWEESDFYEKWTVEVSDLVRRLN
ncbi:MAG: DUF4259 domain-containing protein [Micropepsaceae bacterium]